MGLVWALITGLVEFALAVVTAFPTWLYGRPVNLTWFLPLQSASCAVAPEVRKYDISLYQQLKLLRAQKHDHYDQTERISATVAVFRARDTDEPEILLLQSKSQSSPWGHWYGGQWEMTGGGVDMIPHETTLRAAEREAKDEANIDISSIDAFVGDHYFHMHRLRWLWIAHNVKIMFIGQVKGGDAGLRNIKLNYFEHERFCWATEKQLAAMSVRPTEQLELERDGDEVKPTGDQWPRMQYISKQGHQLALRAFEKLREQKAKSR